MLPGLALFAGCLLYPPANDPCHDAREAQYEFLRSHRAAGLEWADNGTVRELRDPPGIVVSTGIEGFRVGQPAPEFMSKIAPALLSAGTEELRVRWVNDQAPKAKPTSPDRTIRLTQFIRGLEVRMSWVNISLNTRTNEVTHVVANFLPDRGLDHEPRLTADQARAKVEALMRKDAHVESNWWSSTERVKISFVDTPAYLAYEFEKMSETGGLGGVLVWVFGALGVDHLQSYEVSVSAATGRVIRLQGMLIVEDWSGAESG